MRFPGPPDGSEEIRILERNGERSALERFLRGTAEGAGRAVLVEGAPGIGKSTLLHWAAAAASGEGLNVLRARSTEMERRFAFGIVRQMFGDIVRHADGRESWLRAADLVPALAALGSVDDERFSEGDFAVLHSLHQLVVRYTEAHGPVVLVADDAHWGDSASLRFLAYLLPRLGGLPVLLLMSSRIPTGPEAVAVPQLAQDPDCEVVRLRPLSLSAAEDFLRVSLTRPAEPEFVDACHAVSGGNPYLLTELVRVLSAEGIEPTAANAPWVTGPGVGAVHRRVALWLQRHTESAGDVARAAAVLGPDASLGRIGAMTGLAVVDVARAVQTLEQMEFVRQVRTHCPTRSETVVEFVHPLVRAAVYESVGLDERIRAHLAAADLLRAEGLSAEHAAAHLMSTPGAGSPEHAAVLHRAGTDALRRGAPQVALDLLRRCRAEGGPADRHTALLGDLAAAAELVDTTATLGYLREMLALTTDPLERAVVTARAGIALFNTGGWEEFRSLTEQSLRELAAAAVDSDLARALEDAMQASMVTADYFAVGGSAPPQPLQGFREEPPRPGWGGRVLDALVATVDLHSCRADAPARARRALAGDELLLAWGADGAVSAAWFTLIAAEDVSVPPRLDAALERAGRHGALRNAAAARSARALVALRRGELPTAAAEAKEAARAASAANNHVITVVAHHAMAEAALDRDDLAAAEAVLSTDIVRDIVEGSFSVYSLVLKGSSCRLLQARGHLQEAADRWLELGAEYAATPLAGRNPAFLPWRTGAAACLRATGAIREARRLAEQDLAAARQWEAPSPIGRALRSLASTLPAADALPLLAESADVLQHSWARLEYARTLHAQGVVLRDRGSRSDARKALESGLALSQACGAVHLAERIRVDLRLAGGRPPRTGVLGVDSLTPRERRVGDLAAAGRSNQEISEVLFITPKTVETHLAAVYRKLTVTRRELIARGTVEEA
ncbi:AAA family ATPase [Kitasatospora sp. NPDC085879]|uniref:helix-turn-helix transcriptional regulator n=1 Tax=Kitasatospora sp. NPDC085879 TaxID=3154769 RepID=UPI0034147ED1